jgi:hypothetical protein
MINVQVHGLDALIRGLDSLAARQMPFAFSKSLTQVAYLAKTDTQDEMRRVFDRPTHFTLNSERVLRATRDNLESVVWFKDVSPTARHHYLEPQVYGGGRPLKAFEARLKARGILPGGWLIVPGAGASLDAFGNMRRGQIVEILSYFDSFREAGYGGNMGQAGRDRRSRSTSSRYGFSYFAIRPGQTSHLHPGIYRRTRTNFGSSIKPVMIFISGARYTKRLDLERIATKTYDENFNRLFAANFDTALQGARR